MVQHCDISTLTSLSVTVRFYDNGRSAWMPLQVTILFCRDCGRYLQPPKHWVKADPESKELLTFCIKRIKGLSKVCDAGVEHVMFA